MKRIPWLKDAVRVFVCGAYLWYVAASNIWTIREFLPYLQKIYAVVSSMDIAAF